MSDLIVEITMEGEEPKIAHGTDIYSLMSSIGECAQDHNRLIVGWTWIKARDGYKGEHKPEPPKERKRSPKKNAELDRKLSAWFKD